MPDEATIAEPRRTGGRASTVFRVLGALSVLVVGAVHLEQYFAVHFQVVPIIGPLFALNFAGATLIGLGLLLPTGRLRVLFALGAIGLAATSFVFLFVSEQQPLFGFQDHGYRPAIVIALAAEAVTVVSLGAYSRRPHATTLNRGDTPGTEAPHQAGLPCGWWGQHVVRCVCAVASRGSGWACADR